LQANALSSSQLSDFQLPSSYTAPHNWLSGLSGSENEVKGQTKNRSFLFK
jgi:hypothetical protein